MCALNHPAEYPCFRHPWRRIRRSAEAVLIFRAAASSALVIHVPSAGSSGLIVSILRTWYTMSRSGTNSPPTRDAIGQPGESAKSPRPSTSSQQAVIRRSSARDERASAGDYEPELEGYRTRASIFLEAISKKTLLLFVHWRKGIIGAFAAAPAITVVGLRPIAAELGGERSVLALAYSLAWLGSSLAVSQWAARRSISVSGPRSSMVYSRIVTKPASSSRLPASGQPPRPLGHRDTSKRCCIPARPGGPRDCIHRTAAR
jgi:hypothetical protein